jgi:predicted anti-sigma-YlaC factor YlaD
MNCESYQEHISALIDHELDDERSADLFTHLGKCTDCRVFFMDVQRIQRHIAETPLPAVSPALDARVRTIRLKHGWQNLLHSVRTGAGWWQRRLQIPVPAFGMLVLMVLASIAVAITLLRQPAPYTPEKATVYIMSLSPIEVRPTSPEPSSHIQ